MKEEEILKFWEENKIFEKSLEKEAPKGDFVFYDGPPFANGLPHYGHILASIIKDAVPRYKTMRGYRVPRRWGWDCHGLPVENLIETELNLKSKKDIEKFGIEKFNKRAEKSVLRYADEWKKIIPAIGRWVDMKRDYRTMDWKYTESVWWAFKTLYDQSLVYEGYKSMHICPRCETTLSNFEVTQGYKEIKDISVIVKFKLESEPNTFILAWTTTPWTLPGNVALAVNPDIEYVKIKIGDDYYILAKNRLEAVRGEYEIIEEFKGKDLVGKKYKPLFPYYANGNNLKNRENGWKIYGADFVTIEEGTGVVHIAPAFGEDDMEIGKKHNLPFIQHIGMDGKFKPEVRDFAGLPVKPKEKPQATDIEIIKWLDKNNKLFLKKSFVHSYPFCWRCDTPLLNYAASSWFVRVTEIKERMIKNNKKINWVPSHLKEGRFGKWLEGARDWAISRSRFWGAPLPVWKCENCGKIKPAGSIDDIKKFEIKSGNSYFVMRHGEAENNTVDLVSSNPENSEKYSLTERGRVEVIKAVEKLKDDKIDIIFTSDFCRTRETAMLAAEKLGLSKENVVIDERLREINTGIFDGRNLKEYHDFFSSLEEKFYKNPPKGENLNELKKRMGDFIYDIETKYKRKNILIVSHEYSIWLLCAAVDGMNEKMSIEIKENKDDFIKTGQIMKINFAPLPHDENYVLDLHRPYIDKIKFDCDCGGKAKRVPEVFDCWFESGSMPYGQAHYPFEQKEEFEKNFSAEFIAEGVDQTRGWFYTLLALSTALFNETAYKNVIVNGIILAENGQKMSKRLKNYPDPMYIVEKYGADALRYYLLSSPAVHAESLNFSEKGVDDVNKKVISKIRNVISFYKMYADKPSARLATPPPSGDRNILDEWILARLGELGGEITAAMDNYELDKAVRPIGEFVDDLSNWYIRRSRGRFKDGSEDGQSAAATTRYVMLELAKLIAPFAPFVAEEIYQDLKGEEMEKSVHLKNWPAAKRVTSEEQNLLEEMKNVRRIVAFGLEERAKAKIRVRQPLSSLKLKIKNKKLKNN
ncbi:MAG TPA: isoleucine--tRNA ligase, partial [bacterium]|nr:isoleucine--tRNA ligase [bacterium]